MLNLTPEHEDERRALFSFPEAKVLQVKQDCVLGKHYHKLKTEVFVLVTGQCKLLTAPYDSLIYLGTDGIEWYNQTEMKIGEPVMIVPCIYHEFHIKAGSILIGLNSQPFDGKDDYKL